MEANQDVKALIDFAGTIKNVITEAEAAAQHLETLRSELTEEYNEMSVFIQNELLPLIEKIENGEADKREIQQLIENESQAVSLIESVNSDLEKEISELSSLGEDLAELEKEGRKAEQSLNDLKNIEQR